MRFGVVDMIATDAQRKRSARLLVLDERSRLRRFAHLPAQSRVGREGEVIRVRSRVRVGDRRERLLRANSPRLVPCCIELSSSMAAVVGSGSAICSVRRPGLPKLVSAVAEDACDARTGVPCPSSSPGRLDTDAPENIRAGRIRGLSRRGPYRHESRPCGLLFSRRARGTACPSRRCRWRARPRFRCRRSSPSGTSFGTLRTSVARGRSFRGPTSRQETS